MFHVSLYKLFWIYKHFYSTVQLLSTLLNQHNGHTMHKQCSFLCSPYTLCWLLNVHYLSKQSNSDFTCLTEPCRLLTLRCTFVFANVNIVTSPCERPTIIAGHEVLQWCNHCRPGPIIAGPNRIYDKTYGSSLLHLCGYFPLIQKISILFTYLNTRAAYLGQGRDTIHIMIYVSRLRY